MEQQQNAPRNIITKNFDLLENIFVIVFASGTALLSFKIYSAKYMMWFGAALLALIYLIKSFESPKNNFFDYIIYKFIWLGPVLVIFGIISKLLFIPKSNLLLWIAFFISLIGAAGAYQLKFENKDFFAKRDYIRIIVWIILSFLFAIL
jgi:hypothetical protein